jgi:hypothetical protein
MPAELIGVRLIELALANAVVTAALDHTIALGARWLAINHDSVHFGSHFLIKMIVESQFGQ